MAAKYSKLDVWHIGISLLGRRHCLLKDVAPYEVMRRSLWSWV